MSMMLPEPAPAAGPDDLYEQARQILQQLLDVEPDPANSAEIATWIRGLYKIQANNQKMVDDGLAGKFSPAAMRKLGG